ncbi:heparan-alpha-glucosaminide N-acetyltransferase-like [Neocloeon triangulifer]|uniref:heparan-alpha-glucosaminide N-acetyltransferase-like n=1 Tax=Neocloeon triangulifer TaxID=2078957 RepID=UPI00286F10D1|nr:heparan-alpha-glucosaminide N-acetyltransferase-like [Neocloeon triangulifer]
MDAAVLTQRTPRIFEVNEQRCNLSSIANLNFSEACLFISSTAQDALHFLGQSLQCVNCDLIEWATIAPNTTVPILVKSASPVIFEIRNAELSMVYKHAGTFGERGVFATKCSDDKCDSLVTVQEPDDALFAILILLVVLLGLQIFWFAFQKFSQTNWYQMLVAKADSSNELENDLGSPSAFIETTARTELQHAVQKHKSRVKSLDTFRGICITLMIFVNYGGGKYPIFEHATWNGLTVADILFPSFMWIMGLSMALSMRSQLRSGVTRRQLALTSVTRGLKLILIGLILNSSQGNNSLNTFRIPGVLQRLGVAYIVVSVIEAFRMKLQSCQQPHRLAWLQDVADSWLQWVVVLVLVGIHTALTFALPVPGCPTGYLGPGGIQEHGIYKNCTGGAAGYIDRIIFGSNHIYQHPTVKKIYYTDIPYDPEGLLGHFNAILLVSLGVQAGRIMLTYTNPWSRIVRWMVWGSIVGLGGAFLCNFSKESGLIPVNKNLFSLSFVLVSSSLDFFFLSLLYLIIDVKHLWSASPFYFTGMNSLLIYTLHDFTRNMLPWRWQPLGNTHAEVLFMDAWAVSLWVIISYIWFCRNFFFTV